MTVKNEIKLYFHCAKCLEELPDGESPAGYARYSMGRTDTGLQIWCERHNCNITKIEAKEVKPK